MARKKELTDLQIKQKLLNHHEHCPFCNSEQLEADNYVGDGNFITTECKCLKCGASWTEYYKLHDIRGINWPSAEE